MDRLALDAMMRWRNSRHLSRMRRCAVFTACTLGIVCRINLSDVHCDTFAGLLLRSSIPRGQHHFRYSLQDSSEKFVTDESQGCEGCSGGAKKMCAMPAAMQDYAEDKDNDISKEEQWLRDVTARGNVPGVDTFNKLLTAAAKEGDLAKAERWFELAQSVGVPHGIHAYNMVISAATKDRNIMAAKRWFRRVSEDGLKADTLTFNIIMRAAMQSAMTSQVEELFWDMKAEGLAPDATTWRTMRWALGRQRVAELRKMEAPSTEAIAALGTGQIAIACW
jgi:pentatricopeptide repeat protein